MAKVIGWSGEVLRGLEMGWSVGVLGLLLIILLLLYSYGLSLLHPWCNTLLLVMQCTLLHAMCYGWLPASVGI